MAESSIESSDTCNQLKHVDVLRGTFGTLSLTSPDCRRLSDNLSWQIKEAHQVFVETAGYKFAMDSLDDPLQQQLILLDAPGCGKTTIALMLLRKYSKKKYCCHFIDCIERFNAKEVDCQWSNILVFDDFFGKSGVVDYVKLKQVLKELDVMFYRYRYSPATEDSSHDQTEGQKPDLKVIFTSRSYVFRMAQTLLGEYKHTIMKQINVVDLSEYPLRNKERENMLWKHSKVFKIGLEDKDIQIILNQTENSVGFPYSCKMFMKVPLFQKKPASFFSKPLIYLKDHLQELLLDPTHGNEASALVLILLLEGKLDVADLYPETRKRQDIVEYMRCLDDVSMTNKPEQICQGAQVLQGTYIEVKDSLFVFSHPTVYDAVACIMAETYPRFVLRYTTFKFIKEYIRLRMDSNYPTTADHDGLVRMSVVHLAAFVKRFVDEIVMSNFSETFRHDIFKQTQFVDDIITELRQDSNFPEVIHKTDKTYGQCLLFWSMFSSSECFVQKLYECTTFEDKELLEGFLGCAISGNTKSLDVLTENSTYSFVLDRVTSATIGDILQTELNAEKRMKSLPVPREKKDQSLSNNPFLGAQNDGLLHLACIHSHCDVVKRFLKLGCPVDAPGELGRTPLMYASRLGHDTVADILLKAGADINITDEEGARALHLAARGGHIDVAKILLENGVNINEKGEHDRTPLLYACCYGYSQFVKFCLENGADTSFKSDTNSCLHFACESGSLDTVKTLVEYGMDIEETGYFGCTPIMYACRRGYFDIVNYLRSKGADLQAEDDRGENIFHLCVFSGNVDLAKDMLAPDATQESICDSQHRSPFEKASTRGHYDMLKYFIDNKKELVPVSLCLMSACYNGHMTLIKMLIDMVDDINVKGEKGRTALIRACLGGQTETAELLISKEADVHLVDDYGTSCWQYACDTGRVDLVKLLLKKGFTVNTPCQKGRTSLMIACRLNHKDLFEFLVEYDRNAVYALDTFDCTCLHHSCIGKHDNPQILERLFDLGVKVNCRDGGLKTPAMYASNNGLTNIFHCLVEHGADLNLKDKYGQTCLHCACFSKNVDIIRYLVGCGLYIICEDNNNTTPLMSACFRGNPDAVDVLLELGADATKRNFYREACVHTACKKGHVQVVEVLVRYGVDMEMEGTFGRTPLMYACRYGMSDVVDYLREVSVRVLRTDANGANSLHLCCMDKNDDCSVVSKLVEFGINVNCRDDDLKTPAMYASKNGLTNILHYLVEHGADLNLKNKNKQTCLHYACFSNNENTIRYLVDCGVNINCEDTKKRTPLMTACFRGNPVAVDVLLELGADATKLDQFNEACVNAACRGGHVQVVEVLVRHGVDMEMEGHFGRTPFMYACLYGKSHVVDYLCEIGVRVLETDENGANSLHLFCMGTNDDCSVASKLIEFGIDVNSRDRDGMTPIMHACYRGNSQLFEFLYSKGANIAFEDGRGTTCLDFARNRGHHDLANKIISYL